MKEVKEILQNKLSALEKLKPKVEKSLKRAPDTEATLIISSSHGTPQYYLRDAEHTKQYIPKNNLKFIAPLAQKEYDQALQKEIENQEKQIKKILKQLPKKEIQDVYNNLPYGRKSLVTPHFLTDEQYVERWLSVKYEGKPGYDDDLKYTTNRGEKVRSKSEKIIADTPLDFLAEVFPYRGSIMYKTLEFMLIPRITGSIYKFHYPPLPFSKNTFSSLPY